MSRPVSCPQCGSVFPEGATECPVCSAQTLEARHVMPEIAGYKMLRPLGAGGMGAVFLAEDQTLGRRVAIKVISAKVAGESESAARFLREARSMATVEHPHIVRIYSFGETAGQAYLVMEYVDGEDLARRIKREGKLPVPEALRIARQVCEALEAAWEHHIVHRDVKPSNVLLDKRGRVRVADFGLAKPLRQEGDATLTQGSYILGTPQYAAPEQVRGGISDYRSDMYSAGILLFEIFTGQRPFDAPTAYAIAEKQVHDKLPSLAARCPEASAGVVRLVEWMTEKDPAKRPATYREVLETLDAELGARPATPPPTPTPAPSVRRTVASAPADEKLVWRKKHAAVLAAVLMLAAMGALYDTLKKFSRPAPAIQETRLTVAVTPFYGPDEDSTKEGRVMAAMVERAIQEKLGRYDVKVLGVEETRDAVRDHAAARALGEKLGANVVVWGQAFALRGETEIQPYFTLVLRKQEEAGATPARETAALSGKDPLAQLEQRAATAMRVQAAAPNQIEVRKTSAAGVGDVALFLAGLHSLYTDKNPVRALEIFDSAPLTSESLRYRAEALLEQGKLQEARVALQESVRLDAKNAQSYAMLGDLAWKGGRRQEAIAAYEAAARAGGAFQTREAILFEGKLYFNEKVDLLSKKDDMVFGWSPYLLGIEPGTGRVVERHRLPDRPSAYRFTSEKLEITFADDAGNSGTIILARGRLDRPVHYTASLLHRRMAVNIGAALASNFLFDWKPGEERFADKKPGGRKQFPRELSELERALVERLKTDQTQPWNLFALGQAYWAQGRKAEAEKAWQEMLAGEFPGIAYMDYAWMAMHSERYKQHDLTDRLLAESLRRRKLLPQPIRDTTLIERLINTMYFGAATRVPGLGNERKYILLNQMRELTGMDGESDLLVAAMWESYFRRRGDTASAQKEAATRKLAEEAPVSAIRILASLDMASHWAIGLSLSLSLFLLLVLGKSAGRWAAAMCVGGATSVPASGQQMLLLRILRMAVAAAGGVLIVCGIFFLFPVPDNRPALIFVLGGAGILLLLRLRVLSLSATNPLPTPFRMVAGISRQERLVFLAGYVLYLVSNLIFSYVVLDWNANISTPTGLVDSPGSLHVIQQLEKHLHSVNTPQGRFVAAVANHHAGNFQRAEELYRSLPDDSRAHKNLTALRQGEFKPPESIALADVHRAGMEGQLRNWASLLVPPLDELGSLFWWRDRSIPGTMIFSLLVWSRVVLIAGPLIAIVLWLIPAQVPGAGTDQVPPGRTARVFSLLIPGLHQMLGVAAAQGFAVLCLAAVAGLAIGVHLSLVMSTELHPPALGIWSAEMVSNFTYRSAPIELSETADITRASLGEYYWTLFWAFPYARVWWPVIGLITLGVLAAHARTAWRLWGRRTAAATGGAN